jgi:hypothetical protein
MLGATAMMATLAFFQPFKHPDILSINTGAQMVVLLVLFAAMFLLVNGGGSAVIAAVLVLSTLAPLLAGVMMTLRLPKDARAREAGDTLSGDLSSLAGSVKGRFGKKARKAAAAVRDAVTFGSSNPMHAEDRGEAERTQQPEVEMQRNPGGSLPEGSAGRPSDLVAAGERPSPSASTDEHFVL